MSRIGIIIGTTRDNSAGKVVGEWLYDLAQGRQDGVEYTLLDLKEFDVPLLTTDVIPATANKQYADEKVQAWSDAVDACDGFVFVTPEYNRSVPAPMKNAIDVGSRPYGQSVFSGKPAAVISASPGAIGGFGANHHLRQSLVFLDMPVLQQPESYLGGAGSFFDEAGQPSDSIKGFLQKFIDTFARWIEIHNRA